MPLWNPYGDKMRRRSYAVLSFFAALSICTSVHCQNSTGADSSVILPLSLFPSSRNSTLSVNTYSSEDNGWDEWKHGRFPTLFPESGGGFLISYVQLENLLSELLTLIYGWGDSPSPELMDDGGKEKTVSHCSTSGRQNASSGQRRARTLLNTLFCCFTGGCGGGDGHDENEGHQHLLSECEASAIIEEEEEQEETSHNTPSGRAVLPQPSAIAEAQIEVDIDPPGHEISAPQAENSYILIGHNVYRSEVDQNHGLVPGNNQEIVYVYVADTGKYVPTLLTNATVDLQCTICLSVLSEAIRLGCGQEHSFCRTCTERLARRFCPSCNTDFDTTEPDRKSRRQVAELSVECPWCQHSSTLSEIAGHMKSCEQHPEACAHCNQRFAPEELALHLQQCTKELGDTNAVSEDDVRKLAQQLAEALSQAALPQSRRQASQWVRFPGGTVLHPVQGSPGLLMQPGADESQPEFYLRLDFSNISGKETSLQTTVIDTHCEANGIRFAFRVSLKFGSFCNFVDLRFSFAGSRDQLPGSWVLTVLDHQGEEILSEISAQAAWKLSKTGEWVVFDGWKQAGNDERRFNLLSKDSRYWKKQKNHRIMYYRLSFQPWQ